MANKDELKELILKIVLDFINIMRVTNIDFKNILLEQKS